MVMTNVARILGISTLMLLGSFNHVNVKQRAIKKIVIDPGHGGGDTGAVGKFSKEKDTTLQIALVLGKLIEQHMKGVQVIYTRQQDVFVTLHDRAKIANKNNADVFISIHCNAAPKDKTAHGTETYTMGLHTSKYNIAVAKRENDVILMERNYQTNYQGFNLDVLESHILHSLYQSAYNECSLKLAENIEYQFKNRVGRRSRGVKQAGFLILWKTTAPSVLVEVGFVTHPKEERYLNSQSGQMYLASGIFRALRDYKCALEAA